MRVALVALGIGILTACGGDRDEDGPSRSEEKELGTNPKNADSDGDGFIDGDEVDVGDPLDAYTWPYDSGQWPNRLQAATEAGIGGSDWAVGSTAPNFRATDQHGNIIDLHQFYGYIVVMDYSAGWCGPCLAMAEMAQESWASHRQDGVIYIHALIEDARSRPPTPEFIDSWTDTYGLGFPVIECGLRDATACGAEFDRQFESGLYTGGIPYVVVIDRDMTVYTSMEGASGRGAPDAHVLAVVEEMLAAE